MPRAQAGFFELIRMFFHVSGTFSWFLHERILRNFKNKCNPLFKRPPGAEIGAGFKSSKIHRQLLPPAAKNLLF